MTEQVTDDKLVPADRAPGTRYTEAEINRGLTALAVCSGNGVRAEATLAEQGVTIPKATLYRWKRLHAQLYLDIEAGQLQGIYSDIAARNEDLADQQADLEESLVKHLAENFPDLDARDASTALRNVAVAKGLNIDKATVARGRPNHITDQGQDPKVIIRRLRELGVLTDDEDEPVDAEEVREIPLPETPGQVNQLRT